MKILSFIFLIVCSFNLKAQTINVSFNNDGISTEIEETIGIVLRNDKYYILGLGRTNGGLPNRAIELFITNKEGNLLSNSSNKQNQYSFAIGYNYSFQVININELMFVTVAQGPPFDGSSYYAIMTSYDTLLNINWQKTYIGNNSFFRTFQKTPEGDYIVLGETGNIGNGFLDVLLMKLDSQGNEIWRKTYGGIEDDRGFSLAILDNGNYLIGAKHIYEYTNGDGWLIKTDTAGNVIWDKYIGDSTSTELGIHIFGDKYFFQSKDTMHLHPWDGFYAIETFGEFDANGNVLWIEELERKDDLVIRNALKLQDGGFLIVTDYVDLEYQGQVAWIIKYDENRKKVWERYYYADHAESNGLIDVEEDEDGNLVFAGTILTTDTLYNSDIWLLKLNADGCLDGGDCGEPIGILDLTIAKENFTLQVNPNPVKTTAKILIKNSTAHLGEEITVSIYNLQGKKVFENLQKLKGQLPIVDLNCNNWQKGVYYVKASIGNKEYGQVKFLKN